MELKINDKIQVYDRIYYIIGIRATPFSRTRKKYILSGTKGGLGTGTIFGDEESLKILEPQIDYIGGY